MWSRLFGKKPQSPKLGRGHRGVAAGRAERAEQAERYYGKDPEGELDYTLEEVEKWKPLSESEVEGFVNGMQPLFVNSSNVAMAQFYPEENKMQVEYHGGGAYMYSNVSAGEALAFAQALSKGSFIWDHFRIRGTRDGHRKPFTRL